MIYLELFLTFLQIGAVSFGGGYGMISLIREKVLAHGKTVARYDCRFGINSRTNRCQYGNVYRFCTGRNSRFVSCHARRRFTVFYRYFNHCLAYTQFFEISRSSGVFKRHTAVRNRFDPCDGVYNADWRSFRI